MNGKVIFMRFMKWKRLMAKICLCTMLAGVFAVGGKQIPSEASEGTSETITNVDASFWDNELGTKGTSLVWNEDFSDDTYASNGVSFSQANDNTKYGSNTASRKADIENGWVQFNRTSTSCSKRAQMSIDLSSVNLDSVESLVFEQDFYFDSVDHPSIYGVFIKGAAYARIIGNRIHGYGSTLGQENNVELTEGTWYTVQVVVPLTETESGASLYLDGELVVSGLTVGTESDLGWNIQMAKASGDDDSASSLGKKDYNTNQGANGNFLVDNLKVYSGTEPVENPTCLFEEDFNDTTFAFDSKITISNLQDKLSEITHETRSGDGYLEIQKDNAVDKGPYIATTGVRTNADAIKKYPSIILQQRVKITDTNHSNVSTLFYLKTGSDTVTYLGLEAGELKQGSITEQMSVGEWHTVSALLNFQEQTIHFYLDGQKMSDVNTTYSLSNDFSSTGTWGMRLKNESTDAACSSICFDDFAVYGVPEPGTFEGGSVSLTGEVVVNFYMDLPEATLAADSVSVKFVQNDKEIATDNLDTEDKKDDYYKFSCPIEAKKMADDITATLCINDNETKVTCTYSIQEYAETIINDTSGAYTENAIALAKALLNYGAYAQTYFDYNVEKLANANCAYTNELETVISTALSDSARAVTGSVSGVSYYGSSVLLESITTIRHYFVLEEGVNMEDYTVKVDDGEGAITPTAITIGNKSGFYVEVKDVKAQNYDVKHSVAISKDTDETQTIQYGVNSYIYGILTNTNNEQNTKLQNIVKALYLYGVKADGYNQ